MGAGAIDNSLTTYLMLMKWRGEEGIVTSPEQLSAALEIVVENAAATLIQLYAVRGRADFCAFLAVDPDAYARLYRDDPTPTVDEIVGGIAYALSAYVGVATETLTAHPVDTEEGTKVRQRCTTGLGVSPRTQGPGAWIATDYLRHAPGPGPNEPQLKLGKLPMSPDPRTLNLTRFLPEELPTPQDSVDYGSEIENWGLFGNDTTNDCAFAAQGHAEMLWAASTGQPLTLTDADVLAAYTAATGFDPERFDRTGNNGTDIGVDLLTALKFWSSRGIADRKIKAFGEIDRSDIELVKLGIDLFGCAYVGFGLPDAVRPPRGARPEEVLDWVVEPNGKPATRFKVDNGHCAIYVGYDASGLFAVSWGRRLHVTWGFHRAYCTELYAMLSPDWKDPDGFKMDELETALAEIRRDVVPSSFGVLGSAGA